MKKLWVARNSKNGLWGYTVYLKKPKKLLRHARLGKLWRSKECLFDFCPKEFEKAFPFLKLEPGECKRFTVSV